MIIWNYYEWGIQYYIDLNVKSPSLSLSVSIIYITVYLDSAKNLYTAGWKKYRFQLLWYLIIRNNSDFFNCTHLLTSTVIDANITISKVNRKNATPTTLFLIFYFTFLLSLFSCPSCGPLTPGTLHVSNTDCKAVVHQSSFLYLETWFHLYFILFFNICNNTLAFLPCSHTKRTIPSGTCMQLP